MTRQDYRLVAAAIRWQREGNPGAFVLDALARHLADDFAAQRPEFDRARFLRDCGMDA